MSNAPTLVFIPGLLSDETVWAPVAERLPVANPVHFAAVTGHRSIEAMASAILSDSAGPLIAAGHSMGARVAMEMSRQAPGRVAGLILADTGHHPVRPEEVPNRHRRVALGHRGMDLLLDDWLPGMVHPGRHGDTALMKTLREMGQRAGPHVHEDQIAALLARPDAGACLSGLQGPKLLLVGRDDLWSPVRQHQEMLELVSDGELVVIDDAGHFAPLERPDETGSAIAGWLLRHGLGAPRQR